MPNERCSTARRTSWRLVAAVESFHAFLALPVEPATQGYVEPVRTVVALLEARVARVEVDEKDARRLRIKATPKGERLLKEARERRIKLLADAIRHGDEVDIALLSEAAKLIEMALKGKFKRRP